MNEIVRQGFDMDSLGATPGAVPIYLGEKFLPLFEDWRHIVLKGGRGSAKSHSVGTVLPIIAAKSNLRFVCARQFQNSIADSSKELLEHKIKVHGLAPQFKITDREIIHRKTESRFTFIGLDRNPESAKSLEGADICWVEEARTINTRSMEILIPTIRKPGSKIIWTYNPEKPEDPVDSYFSATGEDAPPRTKVIDVSYLDNPWFYHTEMPAEMEHMKRGNFKRYQHIWLGEYDNDYDGKIFQNVEIGRIEVPAHITPVYGMDFGFGSDPSAIVKMYINYDTKEIYIAREAGGRVPISQLGALIDLVVDSKDDYIKCDSSQPGVIDNLSANGYNVEGAVKGPGSVKTGITWMQGFRIIIDPDCSEMRDEARLYTWQKDRLTRKMTNVPVDAHNHYWDACRYACEDAQRASNDNDNGGGVYKFGFGRKRR
jgi:phage terminase large subunit